MEDHNGVVTAKMLLLHLLLLLVFLVIIESVTPLGNGGEIMCMEKERRALLRFKQGLTDDDGVLASWGGEECCGWEGVTCSNTTHRVVALQLQDRGLYGGNITDALLGLHDLDISHLDLSGNRLEGQLPPSFGTLGLAFLNLSHNRFTGSVPHFSDKLFITSQTIDVSFNNFSGFLPSFHPKLTLLHLSRNMFRGPISSLCTYRVLGFLDLSYNYFSANFPPCLLNLPRLMIVDLANNMISGEFAPSLITLMVLILRNNNLSGELPPKLDNPGPGGFLTIFDVGGNQLSGTIPKWVGNFRLLKALNLRDNKFHGIIPPEFCNLIQVQIMDLSRNNISGTIPKCFNNFSPMIDLNLADGSLMNSPLVVFVGGSVFNMASYIENTFVSWKSKEREFRKTVGFLTLIDLSSNNLEGNIPKEFSLMRALVSLNLSRNHLSGKIDSNIGQMGRLDSLDLSRNQLSGEIPIGLAHLDRLSVLDLSNNKLRGRIPTGTQLQTFDSSAYGDNDGLCGSPLAPCDVADDPPISPTQNGKHNYFDKGFYIFVASGYFLGFCGAFGVSLFRGSWMNALIDFWKKIWDWMYVRIAIRLRRLR